MVSVEYYRDQGYLPQALINFLAFLGWNPGGTEEIFDLKELIAKFDIHKVQKAGAIFNPEKLRWFNREYITRLSEEDFDALATSFLPDWIQSEPSLYQRLRSIIREKISVFGEIKAMFDLNGELSFVRSLADYDGDLLLWKKQPDRGESMKHINSVKDFLMSLSPDQFTADNIKNKVWQYAEDNGRGNVLWPFRVAITGKEKSPDPFASSSLIGKDESLRRLDIALSKLA
jgi:glutamyl/glutaminyl-tRNA synthetase